MSWVSKQLKSVGKVAKKAGKAIGKGWEAIDDYALPAIGFALGGPAGAALGAAGARAIGDGKFDAKATLLAGAKGGAMGALGSAAGLAGGSGLKALGSSALKVASNPVGAALNVGKAQLGIGGGGNAASSLLNANISADGVIPAAANAVGQGAGRSVLGTIGNAIGGVQGAMDLGLGGLSAYQGYKAQQKADKLQGQALDLAKARDAELAPMRQAAIQKLMAAQRPDLSSDFASANPFARPLKRLG